MNYVFVDFENVQQMDLARECEFPMSLVLMVGEKQKSLKMDLVVPLLAKAADVQLIRLTVSGRNALDFALAYHLGRVMADNPSGYFHIVSKDRDFDALVKHVKGQGHRIWRHDTFEELPFLSRAEPGGKTPTEPAEFLRRDKFVEFVENLESNAANRPKRAEALHAALKTHLGGSARDDEVASALAELKKLHGISTGAKGALTYPSSWSR